MARRLSCIIFSTLIFLGSSLCLCTCAEYLYNEQREERTGTAALQSKSVKEMLEVKLDFRVFLFFFFSFFPKSNIPLLVHHANYSTPNSRKQL